MNQIKSVLIIISQALLFVACASKKESNVYDEMFSDKSKFVPINTKELKEIQWV